MVVVVTVYSFDIFVLFCFFFLLLIFFLNFLSFVFIIFVRLSFVLRAFHLVCFLDYVLLFVFCFRYICFYY